MDDTAPVIDDSSGALSVRKDMGTPLWNIMLVNRALYLQAKPQITTHSSYTHSC